MALPGVEFLQGLGIPERAAQGVVLGAVLVAVYLVLKAVFKSRPTHPHLTPARCQQCGWVGSVSKHKPVCPRCAAKIVL